MPATGLGYSGEVELLRNEFHRHQDDNREDFGDVRRRVEAVDADMNVKFQTLKDELNRLSGTMLQWSGAIGLAKWSLGLGIPAILAAVVAHVVKHWN